MKLTLNNIFKIIFIIGLSFVAILIFRTAKLNNDFFSQDCDIENLSLHSNNKTNETTTETSLQSILILSDNNYKVYSFTPGINYLDNQDICPRLCRLHQTSHYKTHNSKRWH